MPRLPVTRLIAFLLGFAVAFLPSFGPFAAILFILTARLRLRRSDLPWLLGAIVSAVATGDHGGLASAAFGALQILGPWAVFRAFMEVRHLHSRRLKSAEVLTGLFVGFLAVIVLGFSSVRWNLAYPSFTQVVTWGGNPALFAHMTLVVGSVIALLANDGWLPVATLSLATVGTLASGTLEAAIGLVMVIAYLAIRSLTRRRWRTAIPLGFLGLLVGALVLLGPKIGLGTIGFVVDPAPHTAGINLVRGSELPTGDWWDHRNVAVETSHTELAGRRLTAYRITKRGQAGWLRLQQVIQLQADTTYTASAWILDDGPSQAGIQGWGKIGANHVFALTMALTDHRVQAEVVGPGAVIQHGILAREGHWKRVYATFRYGGDRPLNWYVGLAPDARSVPDTTATFAGFQVEPGGPTAYQPGPADRGLSLAAGRLTMWRVAWEGIRQDPWFGHGPKTFAEFYQHSDLRESALAGLVPAHAHDLILEVLFERGIVGLAGFLLLLTGLAWAAVRNRDVGYLVVLGAILLANVFDVSFYFGGVLYPLAAAAGWRSRELAAGKPAADSMSRQVAVRLVLAGTDFGLAYLALAASAGILGWVGPSVPGSVALPSDLGGILVFLWPAMSWREALYPGYGMTEPEELRRQILAATYSGAFYLVGAIAFTGDSSTQLPIAVLTTIFACVLLPLGRATAKRVLRALGLWGRAVVILGSGLVASTIARTLTHRSLDGLNPIAVFADDVHGTSAEMVGGVPLIGPISAANTFARREGVHHAIVAMDPVTSSSRLTKLDPKDNPFTIVQYVPDLPGLPVLGVRAASLDNLLALQVRNELASPFNRAVKRALDLTGVVVGGLLISPLLLALALAVVLDSRGPALFAHTRVGRNGRRVRVWKFRTMVADAATQLERHLAADPALRAEWEATHKLKDDPRVTRVGRFLRRFSLDELPQLWNVLIGEMSLVGPRPIVDDEVAKYRDAFDLYTMVRPGMTGYWQISGRSDTDYDQRVELDSFYVRNWSVWLDVIVLIKTVSAVLKRDGAY